MSFSACLAREVTTLVHGGEVTEAVSNVSGLLFGDREFGKLSDEELGILFKKAPTVDISMDDLLIDVLINSNLATSKREARTFVESGAVTLNGQRLENVDLKLGKEYFEFGVALLRRGKKNYCVLRLV